jgi:hypothetical protein
LYRSRNRISWGMVSSHRIEGDFHQRGKWA